MNPSLLRAVAACLLLSSAVSCTTAYDAYGRPQQVVDPGAALLGVAAAGLIGFALANDNQGGGRCSNNYYRGGRGYRGYRQNQCNNNWY